MKPAPALSTVIHKKRRISAYKERLLRNVHYLCIAVSNVAADIEGSDFACSDLETSTLRRAFLCPSITRNKKKDALLGLVYLCGSTI